MSDVKNGKIVNPVEWTEQNKNFRIGIKLTERQMNPIYFYSSSLHDSKFLLINIHLFGN